MPEDTINNNMEEPVAVAPAPKKKSSSAYITAVIVLAIFALAGIGFGVYAWFFRPAEQVSSTCPECERCANNSQENVKLTVATDTIGHGSSYDISIEEGNKIRIIEHSMGSAEDFKSEIVGDNTYTMPEYAGEGLAYAIHLIGNQIKTGSSNAIINTSNILRWMLDLTDEQLDQVSEYIITTFGE